MTSAQNLLARAKADVSAKRVVSILICTCNRADSLRETLKSIRRLKPSPEFETEVIVVDNGSTDQTRALVEEASEGSNISCLFEPKRGLSNARNAGVAHARGEIILFTDDDVQVPEDWAERLVAALIDGNADGVTGPIVPPSHLVRPWMRFMHYMSMALSYRDHHLRRPTELCGANMGFRRSVLARVPGFDPKLGAGALGSVEESLFSWQLREAGFKLVYEPEAAVVHHFGVERLRRGSFLDGARKHGRSIGYVRYHWEHNDVRFPRLLCFSYWIRLHLRRLLQPPVGLGAEGCSEWEMGYVHEIEMCKQFLVERQRSRAYDRHGLVKKSSLSPGDGKADLKLRTTTIS